jgi:anti-sigma factor RsiW
VNHHAHVLEEKLFDCYLAERGGERIEPPVAEHLSDCPPCAERYADLTRFMDGLRAEGTAGADALFTPERLRLQQQQIARRLAKVGRPARVLSFPSRFVRRTMTDPASHAAPRWVAAAVAAGLFVGVAVGASYQYGAHSRVAQQLLARQTANRGIGAPGAGRELGATAVTPVATRGESPAQVAADDAFLSDLEVALERPHTRELVAFDAFTPHVREVSNAR